MEQTKILLANCSEKYKRAYTELNNFLIIKDNNAENFKIPATKSNTDFDISNFDFRIFRGMLYSFFDSNSILISINPNNISNKDGKTNCSWTYLICLEGNEIIEGGFNTREEAEYMAFTKSFLFLDTKLFIEHTKERFYDESSRVSCLSMNWEQLNRVLAYKRKQLLA